MGLLRSSEMGISALGAYLSPWVLLGFYLSEDMNSSAFAGTRYNSLPFPRVHFERSVTTSFATYSLRGFMPIVRLR